MWLKSSTSTLASLFFCSLVLAEERKTDHKISNKFFVLADYSLDSFDRMGDKRSPEYSLGYNFVFSDKRYSLFSDVVVGESSATEREFLRKDTKIKEIKQFGVNVPFSAFGQENRFYFGRIASPAGFYEKQRIVPTVINPRSLNDSFFSYYYGQLMPSSFYGGLMESRKGPFVLYFGKFYPEDMESKDGIIQLKTEVTYSSFIYEASKDFIAKIEYVPCYAETSINIPGYSVTKKETRDYFRFGMEKRFLETYHIYAEQMRIKYDNENSLVNVGESIGISKQFSDYVVHYSYVWGESDLGIDQEYSLGVSVMINDISSSVSYRRMFGEMYQGSVQDLAGKDSQKFDMEGIEFRVRYDF